MSMHVIQSKETTISTVSSRLHSPREQGQAWIPDQSEQRRYQQRTVQQHAQCCIVSTCPHCPDALDISLPVSGVNNLLLPEPGEERLWRLGRSRGAKVELVCWRWGGHCAFSCVEMELEEEVGDGRWRLVENRRKGVWRMV